jgi:hypothetical protein
MAELLPSFHEADCSEDCSCAHPCIQAFADSTAYVSYKAYKVRIGSHDWEAWMHELLL